MDNYTLYDIIALQSWIFIFHHSSALYKLSPFGIVLYFVKTSQNNTQLFFKYILDQI